MLEVGLGKLSDTDYICSSLDIHWAMMSERLSSSPPRSLLVMAFLSRLCYVSSLQLKFYNSNLQFTALNRHTLPLWTILFQEHIYKNTFRNRISNLQILLTLKKVLSVLIKLNEVHTICFRQAKWLLPDLTKELVDQLQK